MTPAEVRDVVTRALEAIEAYHRWQEETVEPLRVFHRRSVRNRAEMKAYMPKGREPTDPADREALKCLKEREKAILRERSRYIKTHPQPKTADAIIEEFSGGDGRTYAYVSALVTTEMRRRRGVEEPVQEEWVLA